MNGKNLFLLLCWTVVLSILGCGQQSNRPAVGTSGSGQQVNVRSPAALDTVKEDAPVDEDWEPSVDRTRPIVRVDQTYEFDDVGNAQSTAMIKFPADDFQSFKRMVSPWYIEGGTMKRGEPRIKNALRYLGLEEADVLLEGEEGKFTDDGVQVQFREIGRAKQHDGRWVCSLTHDPQSDYHLVRKSYRNGVPHVTVIGVAGKETGRPVLTQLRVKLPRGAHDIALANRPCQLVYQTPAMSGVRADARPGNGRVSLAVQTKPHIMSALAKLYGDRKFHKLWVARAVFRNNAADTLKDYRVRFRLSGYSDWSRWETTDVVLPGQTVVEPFYPALDPDKVGNLRGQTHVDVQVEYSYVKPDGKTVTDSAGERTKILGINEGVFSDLEVDKDSTWFEMFKDVPLVLGSFTSANDPVIQDVVGMLSKATKGAPTSLDDRAALAFLRALYNLMRVNISYETTPGDKIDGLLHQHLKYGRDVLRTKSGTCVNTSIFFASVVEAAGLDALIWVVPGHAFAGARLPKSGQIVAVETTCCGGGTLETSAPFETAVKATEKTWNKYRPLGLVIEVNIRQLRRRGVQPPELANAGKNPLAEWNITPPPEGQVAAAPREPAPTRPTPAAGKTAQDYVQEGKRYQEAKEWDKAEAAFTKAIEMGKNKAVNYNARALLYMDRGDDFLKVQKRQDVANTFYGKALDDLLIAVKLDPQFTRAWNNAGVICNRTGDNRQAIEFYTHAIACDPNNALAYRNRGKTWLRLGEKAKANADLKKADELEGKS